MGRKKGKTAVELIAAKQPVFELPPKGCLTELEKVLEYNDSGISNKQRISIDQALDLLKSWEYECGYKTLNRICREVFERKGYRYA